RDRRRRRARRDRGPDRARRADAGLTQSATLASTARLATDCCKMTSRPDFGARASRYDEVRPQSATWWRRFDALVEHADLRGRRVLDVGCGTGTVTAALAEKAMARVWGVEQSEGMLEVARA